MTSEIDSEANPIHPSGQVNLFETEFASDLKAVEECMQRQCAFVETLQKGKGPSMYVLCAKGESQVWQELAVERNRNVGFQSQMKQMTIEQHEFLDIIQNQNQIVSRFADFAEENRKVTLQNEALKQRNTELEEVGGV